MTDIQIAIDEYKKAQFSLVVVRDGEIVATSKEKAIRRVIHSGQANG